MPLELSHLAPPGPLRSTRRVILVLTLAGVITILVGTLNWNRNQSQPSRRLVAIVDAAALRPCAEVELIGLRGQGDRLDGRAPAGDDVTALYRTLTARWAGTVRSELYPLPYEQGTLPLALSVAGDIPPAATALARYVGRRAEACPTTKLVIAGQSEGAAVAHWAYPDIIGRVAAIVLMGDPLRMAADYDEDLGAVGIGMLSPWMSFDLRTVRLRDRIGPGQGRVRSYCLPHDRVCAFNPFDLRPSAHLDYRRNPRGSRGGSGVLDRAADFVLALVRLRFSS
jgi:hypothetical protein